MKQAAIYARVSTDDQSADMQLVELREYAAKRGWTVTEFVDTGISGSKASRPALNKMMDECKRRKFDAVLVYRFDRFARSLHQLVNTLAEFDALGISFVSLHEAVDTTTAQGRLLFGIFASIAEFERELIRERTLSGIAQARRRGKIIGRPYAHLSKVSEIRSRRQAGEKIRNIAKDLGIGVTTVHRMLADMEKQ